MVRSQDKAIARLQDEHIARELGVSVETLGLHPFDLIDAGLGHPTPSWRLLWQTSPPDAVSFYGSGEFSWSEVPAMPAEFGFGRRSVNDAEKLRRYERAYVAWMLGIPREVLDRYPYRIVDVRAPGGSMPAWRILWTRSPPRGVEAQRSSYTTWTDIPSLFDLEDHNA